MSDAGVSADGRRADAASMYRKARERGFRVEFRQRVRVAASQLRRLEPRDGCRIESRPSRRVCIRQRRESAFPASEQEAEGRYARIHSPSRTGVDLVRLLTMYR